MMQKTHTAGHVMSSSTAVDTSSTTAQTLRTGHVLIGQAALGEELTEEKNDHNLWYNIITIVLTETEF